MCSIFLFTDKSVLSIFKPIPLYNNHQHHILNFMYYAFTSHTNILLSKSSLFRKKSTNQGSIMEGEVDFMASFLVNPI